MNRMRSRIKALSAWCLGLLCALALGQAAAGVNGAIFTTTSTGGTVDANLYPSKDDVYLNGGPQNKNDPGLVPDGLYYFQVTDPSGAVLLSNDDISCRIVVVSGGRITSVPTPPSAIDPNGGATVTVGACQHALGTFNAVNGEQPVQLMPYDDTPNLGGEYKAWVTPVSSYGTCPPSHGSHGFCDSDSKTDNFKIRQPDVAYVIACKFNDFNSNHVQDDGEPVIPGWPITASGVDGDTGSGVTAQTDATGCVSFSISGANLPASVTLKEGTLGADWTQTAPVDGSVSGPPAYTVSGGVVTSTLNGGDTLEIDFGNHNPNCVTVDECSDTGGLTVTKDAHPSYTITWGIDKSVDKTLVEQVGGTATFNYTVSVTHDSGSGFKVAGTLTLSNTSFADITANVSDTIDNGGTCDVTDKSVTVGAGEQLTLPYTCTFDSNPGSGTNTVTVTDAMNVDGPVADPDPGTADYDFASATVVDDSVDVTDTIGGDLGTVSYTDPSPTTFTYSNTVNVPAFDCVKYDNTATFTTDTTGTTGSASKEVEVCGPAKTGALTMGFWQNRNGQGIITGQAATGVCPSGTWLKQYAPFQDLVANATCAQVATYVYNLIKGAGTTCGGSTCNAMLKGQMLATALDVYFSDPALGGNKINAPAPIGGVSIDLTKICTNIPTCSSFENDSGAFGGATSLTVSQILGYAASQSNAGGTNWYGQVKATQVKAKDVFDAINNQVAFAP